MLKRLVILTYLLLQLPAIILSQSARIDYLSVEKVNEKAAIIHWRMTAGSTCLNLEVQRSKFGENFKTVYQYPGVCGQSDSSISYAWIDANALPYQISYYRIKLEEGEYTLPFQFDLNAELAEDDFVLFPNPVNQLIQVKIRNEIRREWNVKLYNSKGVLVFENSYSAFTELQIALPNLTAGLYYIQIKSKDKQLVHKRAIVVS